MKRLPTSPEQLRGRRAARWIRESTAEQVDNYGPDSQHASIEASLARTGMIDSGTVYTVTHSGKTVWQSEDMRQMIEDARAGVFDVLVTGYSDRWQRNLRQTLNVLEDELHPAGVAVYFADRRILSSDPSDWDELVREAHDAERYSRRLAVRVSDGQGAKWRRYSDPSGWAPLGYQRASEKPYLLELDPNTIEQAITLYQRYSLGNMSIDQLAETAIARVQFGTRAGQPMKREGIADVLTNRIYRGIVRYKGEEGQRPDLRAMPDDLWYRVQDVMAAKVRGGGPHVSQRVDLLAGILYCVCGVRVRSDGYAEAGKPRKRHAGPCADWGKAERLYAATWEVPIVAQVSQLDLSDRTLNRVQHALAAPPVLPDEVGWRRAEQDRKRLREAFDSGHVSATDFVARVAALDERREALDVAPVSHEGPSPDEAVAYLRNLGSTWADADVQARADMLHSIYDRIEVAGPTFVDLKLRPEAKKHGLALALPKEVTVPEHLFATDAVLACPRGLEPPTFRSAT